MSLTVGPLHISITWSHRQAALQTAQEKHDPEQFVAESRMQAFKLLYGYPGPRLRR